MKFTSYDAKKLSEKRSMYAKTDNLEFLEAFVDSGLECAKVEDYSHKSASSCLSSLRGSIRRYGMFSINCVMRNGEVFLIRKEV
jgi:hypothetical protein